MYLENADMTCALIVVGNSGMEAFTYMCN